MRIVEIAAPSKPYRPAGFCCGSAARAPYGQ